MRLVRSDLGGAGKGVQGGTIRTPPGRLIFRFQWPTTGQKVETMIMKENPSSDAEPEPQANPGGAEATHTHHGAAGTQAESHPSHATQSGRDPRDSLEPPVDLAAAFICGIVHDYANILTVVLSNAALLQRRLNQQRPLDPLALAAVELIVDAGQRAVALNQQVLATSRNQPANPGAVDLNNVLTGLQRLLRELAGDRAILHLRPSPHPLLVRIGASQLEQILINLARNASDAMPEGGDLVMETSYYTPDCVGQAGSETQGPIATAMITVSDTGVGIKPDILARVFEPFFTTKSPNRGLGLGLAQVYAVVRQVGGDVTVHSGVGKGTTFRVFLPLAEEHLQNQPADAGAP